MNYFWAFLIGGLISCLAQILIDMTRLTPARILVLFVVAGVFLTAIGLYEPLVNLAGGGATVPISGFGYAVAKGVKSAVDEKGWLGILTGSLSSASGGISASLVLGFIASLIFKGESPK